MRTRFFHLADIHLGYEQYQSEQRYNDFYFSFRRAVDDALRERVDFVIIAGDLFHQRAISPKTLNLATVELERLRAASIPVVAVMGNHEQPHYTDKNSWLDYLACRGLLNLLNGTQAGGQTLQFTPCHNSVGGFIDIGDSRIYGLAYYGASAPQLISEAAKNLANQTDRRPFTILVTHAGLDNIIPNFAANLHMEELAALRPYVNYVALGHIHKPFEKDGWIFNPGSLEPVNITEAEYRGGGYLVEVDTEREPSIRVEPRRYAKRPFLRRSLVVTGFETPNEVYAGVKRLLSAEQKPEPPPVVELSLEGTLQFDPRELTKSQLQEMIVSEWVAIVALVNIVALLPEFATNPNGSREWSRADLERQVMADLVAKDSQYREQAGQWAALFLEMKQLAVEKNSPETIIEHLSAGAQRIAKQVERGHADSTR